MIEVVTEKKKWNEQIALAKKSDFYYSYDYHHFSKNEDETPILIKYTKGSTTLILPLLLRDIENSDFKDATSVYGYAGVLAINLDDSFKQSVFKEELNTFLNKNKIIAVFSRLHPFIDNQETILSGLGSVSTQGKVVYIDLTDPVEIQRTKFNRRLKTYLNKSRKGCTVIKGNIEEHLETFIHLYTENMRRVDANESYFFSNTYFYELLTSKDYKSELLLAIHKETQTIIGGAIFAKKGNIVQYHLSGLAEEDFGFDPIKLIIDEMRIKSTAEGYKYLNLGGGRGSNEDSLYRFKRGFSKSSKDFKLWKYIVDESAYNMLTKRNLGNSIETNPNEISYFPSYRYKLEILI